MVLSNSILEGRDICKSYSLGEKMVNVLTGVNFKIEKGEIASILGISGAGKSTLLSILGTLDAPDKGVIILNGEDVTGLAEDELAELRNQKIGFVFQFHYLLPEFTAIENVAMPGLIGGKSRDEALEKARNLLKRVGLEERHDHKPHELSGGELQRVAVARSLINDPLIVLADEPTGNLDRNNGEIVYDIMLDLSKTLGTAFLVVTHNESIAARTEKKLMLRDGAIITL